MKLVGCRHCWATQRSFGLWHLGRSPWCIGAGWPPAPAPAQTTTSTDHHHPPPPTPPAHQHQHQQHQQHPQHQQHQHPSTTTRHQSPSPLFCGSWLLQKRSSEFVGWLRYMPWLDEFSLCPLVSLRSFDAFSTRCLALIIFQCFKCVLSCLYTCLPYWFTCEGSLLFTILRKGPFWPCWLAAWFCHGVRGDGGISAKLRKEGYRLCRHFGREKIGEKLQHVGKIMLEISWNLNFCEGMLRDSHWVHPEVFFFLFFGAHPKIHAPSSGLRALRTVGIATTVSCAMIIIALSSTIVPLAE